MLITKACPECNTKPEPDAMIAQEDKSAYRNDAAPQVSETVDTVREFYRPNHLHQTHDFVKARKAEFLGFSRRQLTPWAALDDPNTLVNDADPDTALPPIDQLIQAGRVRTTCIRRTRIGPGLRQ